MLLRLMLRDYLYVAVLAANVIWSICLDVSEVALVWPVVCGPHTPDTLKHFLFWDF